MVALHCNEHGWVMNRCPHTHVITADMCLREDIGNDCRCPACEVRKVEAAEAAQEASEGR